MSGFDDPSVIAEWERREHNVRKSIYEMGKGHQRQITELEEKLRRARLPATIGRVVYDKWGKKSKWRFLKKFLNKIERRYY